MRRMAPNRKAASNMDGLPVKRSLSIPKDVEKILRRSTISDHVLVLPEKLDRATYIRVDKVLKAVGGKWSRSKQGHIFPFNPNELLDAALEEGEVLDSIKSRQFFETPDVLARRMVTLANLKPGYRALEPSAGRGRILKHLLRSGALATAIEIDVVDATFLSSLAPPDNLTVYNQTFENFCRLPAIAPFDAVVMNPPFAIGMDHRHIRLAWKLLRPGGRLVAVCSAGPFFREDRPCVAFRAWLEEIDAVVEELPPKTFHESGTDVNVRLISATTPRCKTHIRKEHPRVKTSTDAYTEAA